MRLIGTSTAYAGQRKTLSGDISLPNVTLHCWTNYNNDESEYWRELDCLIAWWQNNNYALTISMTKDLIADFRKWKPRIHQHCQNDGGDGQEVLVLGHAYF